MGTHGQICGLFPHVFRHHQHSEGVRILTRLQLVRWQVGRENCPLDWQALRRGHFSIRAGRSVRSSGQKTPLFSLECPFPACASTSRPPCAPRRHPLPARSMAPPRWVFQQKSPAVPQFRSPALCSRSRHAALLSSRRIAPLDGSMGPAHGSSGCHACFRGHFSSPRGVDPRATVRHTWRDLASRRGTVEIGATTAALLARQRPRSGSPRPFTAL